MNIYQKMAKITAEIRTVAKNLEVQQTKISSYKAVSERDILDAVKPLEEKYGIYSYPSGRKVVESNILESENVYKDKVTKKTTFMTRIETTYRFVNIDDPSDYIETTVFSEGFDNQDKGSGKAMTYADKYALMKAYKISTGEDPDQHASEPVDYKKDNSLSPNQLKAISGYPEATLRWICDNYHVDGIVNLTREQASEIIAAVNKKKAAQ